MIINIVIHYPQKCLEIIVLIIYFCELEAKFKINVEQLSFLHAFLTGMRHSIEDDRQLTSWLGDLEQIQKHYGGF